MTTLLLLLGLGAVAIGLGLAAYAVMQSRDERLQYAHSMDLVSNAGTGAGSGPTVPESGFRLPGPASYPIGERLREFGHRLTPTGWDESVTVKLDKAGKSETWDLQRMLAAKVTFAALLGVGAFFFGLMLSLSLLWLIIFMAGLTVLGFFAPDIWLSNTATHRAEEIQKALPDTMDLLMISVESGLAFDAALDYVADQTPGPLAGELRRTLQEMQIGKGRADALRSLAARTDSPDLDNFVSAVAQAEGLGIPIVRVLRAQTAEMRTKRTQRTEEEAAKLPVKIIFPTIVFILPALLLVVMGPAAINIARMMGTT